MNDHLLVRVYDVGFGDCTYVRVPDKDEHIHILIDCGSSNRGGRDDALERALENIYEMLPEVDGGKRHLDLLVVTHKHRDHISGFDPDLECLTNMDIERIWLTASMKKDHPDAQGFHTLQNLEMAALDWCKATGLQLSDRLHNLIENNVAPATARNALTVTLPQANGINPLYVFRGFENHPDFVTRCFDTHPGSNPEKYLLPFQENQTKIHVLAPEWKIDHIYLGEELGNSFQALNGHNNLLSPQDIESPQPEAQPQNISQSDFRRLRSRLLYAALSFSETNSHLINDTSVVLLLEWRGKRILFTGDAEWKKRFKDSGRNGSWDVMLHTPEVKDILAQPLDFLKVGHHGSINATPWDPESEEQPVLDKILPTSSKAQVVVSTLEGTHGEINPVPHPDLMKELGRRASNARKYSHDPSHPTRRQPRRTDQERLLAQAEGWIDETVKPSPGWTPE